MLGLLLAASLYGDPQLAFRLADPRVTESSGLVAGSDGRLYTHNDSGDRARFFALGPDGRVTTEYDVPGVRARDWEDLARGPDEQGRPCLWLADIGDNNAQRDNGILLRRVREPVPTTEGTATTGPSTDLRLAYPDGPRDAETLLVTPGTGRVFVVSKPLGGPAGVYEAPARLDPDARNRLTRVADVRARSTGTAGGPGIGSLAQLLFTGGDISPDGTRLALRTYTDVYEWLLDGDEVAAAVQGEPVVTPLPPTEQGEGLAYSADGNSLLTSSEGADSPVYRLTRQDRTPAPAPASASSAPPGPTGSAPETDASQPGSSLASRDTRPLLATAAGVLTALVLAGFAVTLRRRHRATRRPD